LVAALLVGVMIGGLAWALFWNPDGPPGPAPEGMVWVPPGWFWMGSDEFRDAGPVHRVWVDGFWVDQLEVTNEQSAEFGSATGTKTESERPIPYELRKKALPKYRHLSTFSMVFTPPKSPPPEDCPICDRGWELVEGACWKRPRGRGSNIKGMENH